MLGNIGQQQHNIVSDNADFERVVTKVVEHADRYGWLAELIRGALNANNKNAHLQKFIKDYPERNPTPPPAQVDNLAGALTKTQEMLKGELFLFDDSFKTILDRIDTLADYKVLHDSLHDINFGIISEITREEKGLPSYEAKNNLGRLDKRLSSHVDDMRKAVARGKVDAEEKLWVDELEEARVALKASVKEYDRERVRVSIQTIENVLQTLPTEINRKLLKSVYSESDRLPQLAAIMLKVRDAMRDIPSEAANLPRFEKAITSLQSLTAEIKALVNEHDTWQAVEGNMDQLRDLLETNAAKFTNRWGFIRAKIKPYYSGNTEEWATEFQENDTALEDALRRATDPAADASASASARDEAVAVYSAYYDKARWRFYNVDKLLLGKCKTLNDIRKELP